MFSLFWIIVKNLKKYLTLNGKAILMGASGRILLLIFNPFQNKGKLIYLNVV